MCRAIKSHLFFIAILVFAVQNVGAVTFKTKYKISAKNQQLGALKRTINSDGHVSIDLNLMPLPEAEASNDGIDLVESMMSGKIPSLNIIFHYLQSLLSDSPAASATATANNEISITLTETAGQPSSITYGFLGQTCHYSESSQSDDAGIIIGGQHEIYCSNPNDGFQIQPINLITTDSELDEGLEQSTTIQDTHIEGIGSLAAASLSEARGEEVVGQYFLFGQHFEQLLTTLVEGESNHSGLLHLQSIFPILAILPGQNTYEVFPTGYGQELIYNSASNMIIQQDPPNDPNPYGVITTYQLNLDGSIASIVISDSTNEVTFTASEQIVQPSEETNRLNLSDINRSSSSSAIYSLTHALKSSSSNY